MVEVVSCYDGDTCRVRLPWGGAEMPAWAVELFGTMSVRLEGFDTPEIRGRCDREKEMAVEARDALRAMLDDADEVLLADVRGGKYFRLLGMLLVDGKPVGDRLIEAGLARPYSGGTRLTWCE